MNRYSRPLAFTLEADVVTLFARLSFGSAGAITLQQGPYPKAFSKGFCAATLNTQVTTATLSSTSTSVTGAVSLFGVYNGMSVTGTGIPSNTTVSAVDPAAGTFTLSNAATASGSETLTFSGGQYLIQLGTQAGVRLDTYNHLLDVGAVWDESANAVAQAGSSPAVPAAPSFIIINDSVSVRTIPASGNSANTDASLLLQFGTWSGSTFAAAVPDSGSLLRLRLSLCRSSAI